MHKPLHSIAIFVILSSVLSSCGKDGDKKTTPSPDKGLENTTTPPSTENSSDGSIQNVPEHTTMTSLSQSVVGTWSTKLDVNENSSMLYAMQIEFHRDGSARLFKACTNLSGKEGRADFNFKYELTENKLLLNPPAKGTSSLDGEFKCELAFTLTSTAHKTLEAQKVDNSLVITIDGKKEIFTPSKP